MRLGRAEIAPILEEKLNDPDWQQSPWVRFETADTGPGPVRTFSATDPALTPIGT